MSAAVAAPGTNVSTPKTTPSLSLYIQNIPEKLQKHDVKRNLYMLFSTYGPVLDVTALKTAKMRGQAHVLFRDQQSATQAMRHCQGYDFFGRELRISYAKARSNTLAKLTGTFHEESSTKPNASTTGAAPPSSFPAPPGQAPPAGLPAPPGAPPGGLPPPPGLPAKPSANGVPAKPPAVAAAKAGAESAPSPASAAGQKRQRDESDDDGDAPMEEDSEGGEMDMSDSD